MIIGVKNKFGSISRESLNKPIRGNKHNVKIRPIKQIRGQLSIKGFLVKHSLSSPTESTRNGAPLDPSMNHSVIDHQREEDSRKEVIIPDEESTLMKIG